MNPERVVQAFVSGTAGCSGYTTTNVGTGSIVFTRKFIPQWAIVTAIIGGLCFLFGLLLLLYKDTEVLTVTVSPDDSGSRILVSGVATEEMRMRIRTVLNDMTSQSFAVTIPSDVPSALAPPQPGPPSAGENKQCPECAETIKFAARKCRFCGFTFEEAT